MKMTTLNRPYEREVITYAFVHTALGMAMAARSKSGMVALLLGDSRNKLLHDLREALEGAVLEHNQSAMAHLLNEVACMCARPASSCRFHLDLRGTDLELAVWNALGSVQPGDTITYGELARKLELPATAQEVGAACAANRVAVAVPCHRVIKADGSISGYRWGVNRKRKLINLEAVA